MNARMPQFLRGLMAERREKPAGSNSAHAQIACNYAGLKVPPKDRGKPSQTQQSADANQALSGLSVPAIEIVYPGKNDYPLPRMDLMSLSDPDEE